MSKNLKPPKIILLLFIGITLFACQENKRKINDKKDVVEKVDPPVKKGVPVKTDSIKKNIPFAKITPKQEKHPKKNKSVYKNSDKTSNELNDILLKIIPLTQKTEIDPIKENVISGKQGTTVFIPANSLLNGQGKPLTEKIIIQLQENYSINEMISNRLQTLHDDDILQTQGMIYLSATTTQGISVTIDKSKPIRIEFPVSTYSKDAKIFRGIRNITGGINWATVEEPCKKLVPLPIKMVAPSPYIECRKDFGFTTDPAIMKDTIAKYYYTFDDIEKYENTLLATREFKARYYSFCMPELTNIYLNNRNKNMWEIDDLMVQYFIKDSAERVADYINGTEKLITPEQKKANAWLLNNAQTNGHYDVATFKAFAAQKLTKIDTTRNVDTSQVKNLNKAFTAYETTEFGWINCDVFFEDPRAEKIRLFIRTNETPSIVNIIFKDRKIILDGHEEEKNKFRFTKDKDGYNKLPIGAKATILAIGYKNNSVIFSSREITIGQNEIELLDLRPISTEELKVQLKKCNSM